MKYIKHNINRTNKLKKNINILIYFIYKLYIFRTINEIRIIIRVLYKKKGKIKKNKRITFYNKIKTYKSLNILLFLFNLYIYHNIVTISYAK
ncbi:LOW QUALITY PROTEIN: hypothetical protein PFAG_01880 [Plasmodium falciparum Santa Lucia]|nr:LOW QUALITY PROTEIN: hypothetical protein PFAG_01880 [Plasmodium falciparum Santa Lucia]